jgi:hypothetical protein
MLNAAVHSPERGEQTRPSVEPPLQYFFAMLVSNFLKLSLKRRDGVVIIVKRLAEMQKAAFFSGKEKYQPHHYCERGIINCTLR